MKITMTLVDAQNIVEQCVSAAKKWGRHASPPVSFDQLMQALVVLSDSKEDGPTKEMKDELTKLRRQLAACQNRERARKGGIRSDPPVMVNHETSPEGKEVEAVKEESKTD